MRGLNRILFKQLHEQYVSAAYLWIDTEHGKAFYSAAGHPQLLRSREGGQAGADRKQWLIVWSHPGSRVSRS
ncbi:MAG: hypothetical protein DMG41_10805 [Acidobacteria bacterium]|nr:MAG: hypothetical protein DMG42_17605 [Acidobacteriota bacterium]PYT88531.1 MAG: hypothetical protein DMG41_10805 [Acidobacteriota bacterium]